VEQCFHETKTPLLLPLLRSGDDLFQGTSRCRKTPFIGISPNSVKAFVRVMSLRALAGKIASRQNTARDRKISGHQESDTY
jgi:hypothetical protein